MVTELFYSSRVKVGMKTLANQLRNSPLDLPVIQANLAYPNFLRYSTT